MAALGCETTEAGGATPGPDLRVQFQGAGTFSLYDAGGELGLVVTTVDHLPSVHDGGRVGPGQNRRRP